MSDGPYRSLPMNRACKRLAMRAQKAAFEPEQVAEAVCPTLVTHWEQEGSTELLEDVRKRCTNRQHSLFDANREENLDDIRRAHAGAGPLGRAFIDCVEQTLAEGKFGDEAMRAGMHAALLDRAPRDARTIQEHYYRVGSPKQAAHVHARLNAAIGKAPIEDLASQLATRGTSSKRSPPKRGGLDEGVMLP